MNYIILEKARSHKYIRREGMPGHYEYFYEEIPVQKPSRYNPGSGWKTGGYKAWFNVNTGEKEVFSITQDHGPLLDRMKQGWIRLYVGRDEVNIESVGANQETFNQVRDFLKKEHGKAVIWDIMNPEGGSSGSRDYGKDFWKIGSFTEAPLLRKANKIIGIEELKKGGDSLNGPSRLCRLGELTNYVILEKAIRPGLIPIKKVIKSPRGKPFSMTYWIRLGETSVFHPIDRTPVVVTETLPGSTLEDLHLEVAKEEIPKRQDLKDIPFVDYSTLSGLDLRYPANTTVGGEFVVGETGLLHFTKFMAYLYGQAMKLNLDAISSSSEVAKVYPAIVEGDPATKAGYFSFSEWKREKFLKGGEVKKQKAYARIENYSESIKASGQRAIDAAIRKAGYSHRVKGEKASWGDDIQQAWASSSSDNKGVQDYLMEEAYERLSDNVKAITEKSKGQAMVENEKEIQGLGIGVFIAKIAYDSIKNRTQKFFKDLGYKPDDDILVFRGSRSEFFDRRSNFANKINKDAETIIPREDFTIRALSSWSLDPGIAADFSGSEGVIIATKVKVKDIFSHYVTGFGCKNEQEVVLPADAFKSGVRLVFLGERAERFLVEVAKAVKAGDLPSLEQTDEEADWIRIVRDRRLKVGLTKSRFVILEKARPHKYIKRVGAPGHYEYFYHEEAQKDAQRDIEVGKPEITEEDEKLREVLKPLFVVKESGGEWGPTKATMLNKKINNLKSTQEAYELGKTLSRQEATEVWKEYKQRLLESPYRELETLLDSNVPLTPEIKQKMQALQDRSFETQMYRETVEGHLGGAGEYLAFTPDEIEERLGTK